MSVEQKPAVLQPGLILAGLAAVCTALVAVTHAITAPRIVANEQAYLEQSLAPVLKGIEYDGALLGSTIVIPAPNDLPGNEPVTVYRVYANQVPAAALFVVNAPGGFAGPIRLLIGIAANGQLTGIRVLDHRETPGLGDGIESDKSDWIHQFTGRSPGDPPAPAWRIRRDGGEFDQLTGASITPRAVIRGIRDTLTYFAENKATVFAEVAADD